MNERTYWFAGIFFLLIQVVVIIRNISVGYDAFFWFCDFAPGLFAILFFLKADQGIKGLLNIGLLGQVAYAIIMIVYYAFGVSLYGFVFEFPNLFAGISTFVIHISTVIALAVVYKVQPTKRALFHSFIFLALIYGIVLAFTPVETALSGNYNFIYYSETVSPLVLYYTQLWIALAFVFVAFPTYWLQKGIYYLYKRKRKLVIP